ncbi:CPBP family intramembrane glutamic endopeptidase [Streptococcus ovuberis]|uniref:CPBP family intramembrane metalloprotease n=1 Tax=Streptococcus ovuberis TaxID=1936207 RepID=A0A7X6MWV2_9STRE|nr:CPBP family intramembrane glutamic endopeptidase [Streptococcus ovuberis]NKZ19857.1 CPBP family intramembrane metalloprotease [Streptococcus ovuberis]
MSEKKSMLLFSGAYVGTMLMGLVYSYHVKGIAYEDEGFLASMLPFLTVLAAMTILYWLKHQSALTVEKAFPVRKSYILASILPILSLGAYYWLKAFQPNWQFMLPVVATLLVGIGEEMFFRRILLTYLLKRMPAKKAILGSSVAFGLFHAINFFGGSPLHRVVLQVFLTGLMGIFYAYLYMLTQKIAYQAVDHALWDYILMGGLVKLLPMVSGLILVLCVVRLLMTVLMVRQLAPFTKIERSSESL